MAIIAVIRGDLFESMAATLGLRFESDLRGISVAEMHGLAKAIREMPADAFRLREWEDAINYFFGDKKSFETTAEAKSEFVRLLEN